MFIQESERNNIRLRTSDISRQIAELIAEEVHGIADDDVFAVKLATVEF